MEIAECQLTNEIIKFIKRQNIGSVYDEEIINHLMCKFTSLYNSIIITKYKLNWKLYIEHNSNAINYDWSDDKYIHIVNSDWSTQNIKNCTFKNFICDLKKTNSDSEIIIEIIKIIEFNNNKKLNFLQQTNENFITNINCSNSVETILNVLFHITGKKYCLKYICELLIKNSNIFGIIRYKKNNVNYLDLCKNEIFTHNTFECDFNDFFTKLTLDKYIKLITNNNNNNNDIGFMNSRIYLIKGDKQETIVKNDIIYYLVNVNISYIMFNCLHQFLKIEKECKLSDFIIIQQEMFLKKFGKKWKGIKRGDIVRIINKHYSEYIKFDEKSYVLSLK